MKNTSFQLIRILGIAFVLVCGMLFIVTPAGATNVEIELVHVDFNDDTPAQPPLTGGPGQPTYLISSPGTSILVQTSSNGIDTQPVVLTAQSNGQYVNAATLFTPISAGVVRVEATVACDRFADGFILETTAGSGPYPTALVTRLIIRDYGEIQDDKTRIPVGTYIPNQPFRVRIDIDMSEKKWSAAVDNEMDGFDDDPVTSNLPFRNAADILPTVGGAGASLLLLQTTSLAPTAVAYDDIRVCLLALAVDIDIKPKRINAKSRGTIPVVILSTPSFNATEVDPTSLTFGRTGNEPSIAFCNDTPVDVNGDGLPDMVCHFYTVYTGFLFGDTQGVLRGKMLDGAAIQGTGSVGVIH